MKKLIQFFLAFIMLSSISIYGQDPNTIKFGKYNVNIKDVDWDDWNSSRQKLKKREQKGILLINKELSCLSVDTKLILYVVGFNFKGYVDKVGQTKLSRIKNILLKEGVEEDRIICVSDELYYEDLSNDLINKSDYFRKALFYTFCKECDINKFLDFIREYNLINVTDAARE